MEAANRGVKSATESCDSTIKGHLNSDEQEESMAGAEVFEEVDVPDGCSQLVHAPGARSVVFLETHAAYSGPMGQLTRTVSSDIKHILPIARQGSLQGREPRVSKPSGICDKVAAVGGPVTGTRSGMRSWPGLCGDQLGKPRRLIFL